MHAKERASTRTHGCIYMFTHRKSGKQYVGLTRQNFRKRMQAHKTQSVNPCQSGSRYLHAAIRKHGWDAFDRKAIYERVPKAFLPAMEITAIAARGTRAPSGYNLTPGGEASAFSDPAVSAKARANAKAAQDIVFASKEFKEKVGKESKKVWDALSPTEHQAKAQKQTNGRHAEFVRRREANIATLSYERGKYYWERQKSTCLGRIRRRMAKYPERFIGLDPLKDCEAWFGPSFDERRKE